jgi:hypothetical protein
VSAANPSSDGKKVTLTVNGLQANRVVQIRLSNLKSATGESPYATDAYCTVNAFGPGEQIPVGLPAKASAVRSAPWIIRNLGSEALVRPPLEGPYTLRILSPDGRTLGNHAATRGDSGWENRLSLGDLRSGTLLLLEARNAEGSSLSKWIVP